MNDEVTIDGKPYTRHDRHWYEDGSFGFLVEGTAFFLHRSLLSRRSSVMADLFVIPQSLPLSSQDPPDHKNPVFNGISFITLHDKADDFASLMDLVYPATISNKAKDSWDASQIMQVVSLADKYIFEDIKEWAVGELESKHLLVGEGDLPLAALQSGRYSDPKFCIQVVQFARKCALPQFILFAFYSLATTDWTQRLSGEPLLLDDLSPQDRCHIQEGKIALIKAVLKRAYIMPENGNSGARCSTRDHARDSGIWIDPPGRWTELLLHPLEELHFRTTIPYPTLCEPCHVDLLQRTREFRDDLVGHLKEYFRLD